MIFVFSCPIRCFFRFVVVFASREFGNVKRELLTIYGRALLLCKRGWFKSRRASVDQNSWREVQEPFRLEGHRCKGGKRIPKNFDQLVRLESSATRTNLFLHRQKRNEEWRLGNWRALGKRQRGLEELPLGTKDVLQMLFDRKRWPLGHAYRSRPFQRSSRPICQRHRACGVVHTSWNESACLCPIVWRLFRRRPKAHCAITSSRIQATSKAALGTKAAVLMRCLVKKIDTAIDASGHEQKKRAKQKSACQSQGKWSFFQCLHHAWNTVGVSL